MDLPFIDSDKFNIIDVTRIKSDSIFGTLSKVFINDHYFCDGLEPFDRGFDLLTSLDVIKFQKSLALNYPKEKPALRYCAIPIGVYDLDLHHKSYKYKNKLAYKPFNGECPQVLNVPGYSGINIHVGNYPSSTQGCLVLGHYYEEKSGRWHLINSTDTFQKFFYKIRKFKFPTKIRYSRIYPASIHQFDSTSSSSSLIIP